jgi:HD superfamily phosphohydrolase
VKSEKLKIINDPIYGFIQVPFESVFRLIEHPYFQRMRRVRQLGLTDLVYPGAHHTRFHHALGAMHLMTEAIEVLRRKGHIILDTEAEAVTIAILLHDIGHGPYSHALEHSLVNGISHEKISELFMSKLNKEMNGMLSMAIQIFRNEYPKKFLHQLVSGQLDMDRLDYLNRDSFFTGVSEGVISSDRIIKMLEISGDELVIESKGIYSIEKFLVARRLMYWQVYLHKTVVSAENLLIHIIRRAKELRQSGRQVFATKALEMFLENNYTLKDFESGNLLDQFAALDDSDIITSVKLWSGHDDSILSDLSSRLMNRKLFKIILQNKPFEEEVIASKSKEISERYRLKKSELDYYLFKGTISNSAYDFDMDKINILYRDGKKCDITEAADTLNIKSLARPVEKHYMCFPSPE